MSALETLFYHKSLKCCVVFTTTGHRCGYVGVPTTHPLFGIDYDQDLNSPELLQELKNTNIGKRGIVDIFCWDGNQTPLNLICNVHGGLTYSGKTTHYPYRQFEPIWWFGFDCAHVGDNKDWEMLKKVSNREYFQTLWEIEQRFPTEVSGKPRTKQYVEKECRTLANQLCCIGELLRQTRIQILENQE